MATEKQSCIQYLNLRLFNDALSEIIQCELGEIDFSQVKRSTLKKAGPDLCFQPLFKLLFFNNDDDYDAVSVEASVVASQVTPRNVRFADSVLNLSEQQRIR